MSDLISKLSQLVTDLEHTICNLADIGTADDLTDKQARDKALRVYKELRRKYPISVLDFIKTNDKE